ncbi:MAG: RdgB/HAM1 family non-canonical purine NTP pyrophosphatase [Hyphomicrobiales bacterium]|nr:RdgB/HAM1 family non-canonical purine NTP pyrophosphatase [Rickettsiales bacterium]MCP5361780.1 RdgB/HAM1 family non-canonical purine NTP pyrophosphatase [Hyphomicrobiales bacterium]
MARKFAGGKLVVASHNKGKVKEINSLLKEYNATTLSSSDFDIKEPEENADSFIGNAEIKSRYTAEYTQLPSLSDDSGLVVPALEGAPGIYSARWAGPEKDFALAMERVRQELLAKTGTDNGHRAYFVCALSLCWPDGHEEHVEGRVDGTLVFPPRGKRGFGYDPIFVADGYTQTFAEIDPEEKHRVSHRADAFAQLVAKCFA